MVPPWADELSRRYWHLRYCRKWDSACKRRHYRKIAEEKKRLLVAGVPYIEVHLVTRYLANPDNPNSYRRLQVYYAQGRLFG